MARSYYIWGIEFEDGKKIYVLARDISQILNSDNEEIEKYDFDCIIRIEQLELAQSWTFDEYENLIDLHYDD